MTDSALFSEAELSLLRGARYDPNAIRHCDLFAGGFFWSDEAIKELAMASDNYLHRYVIYYRSLLSQGKAPTPFPLWDQLLRECPDWPGFRPERRTSELATEYERVEAEFLDQCDSQ